MHHSKNRLGITIHRALLLLGCSHLALPSSHIHHAKFSDYLKRVSFCLVIMPETTSQSLEFHSPVGFGERVTLYVIEAKDQP
jgi:hypothetical protein